MADRPKRVSLAAAGQVRNEQSSIRPLAIPANSVETTGEPAMAVHQNSSLSEWSPIHSARTADPLCWRPRAVTARLHPATRPETAPRDAVSAMPATCKNQRKYRPQKAGDQPMTNAPIDSGGEVHVAYGTAVFRLRSPYRNDYIVQQIEATKGFYELPFLESLSRLLRPNDLVLDIGANIGNHAIFFAGVCEARVVAYEPEPALARALCENLQANSLDSRASVRAVALGSREGFVAIAAQTEQNSGATRFQPVSGDTSGGIPMETVDEQNLDGPVRLMKIDVEGMEGEVLQGALKLIEQDRPIIAVEQIQGGFGLIRQMLDDRAYTLVGIYNATPTAVLMPTQSPAETRDAVQHVALSNDELRRGLRDLEARLERANRYNLHLYKEHLSRIEKHDAEIASILGRMQADTPLRNNAEGPVHETGGMDAAAERASGSVFIYGSCVSRDPFSLVEGSPPVREYIARSPVASALGPHPRSEDIADIDTAMIKSSFQRRMVEFDLTKRFKEILVNSPHDVLVIDFIDERIPQVVFDDGARVTYSVELRSSGYVQGRDRLQVFPSEDHMRSWKAAMLELLALIPSTKIVVNRVYWAKTDTAGNYLDDVDGIGSANSALRRMYEWLEKVPGLRFIDYPAGMFLADPDHQWGVSPFHFHQPLNEHFIARLRRLLDETG